MANIPNIQGSWKVTTNGWSGTLTISSVDEQGQLTGQLTISTNDTGTPTGEAATSVSGYWDAGAQELWFVRDMRNIHPEQPLPFQVYTAYGYRSGTSNITDTLAGAFEAFFATDRHRFGWVSFRQFPG